MKFNDDVRGCEADRFSGLWLFLRFLFGLFEWILLDRDGFFLAWVGPELAFEFEFPGLARNCDILILILNKVV